MREEFQFGLISIIFTEEGIYYKNQGVENKYYPYGSIDKIKVALLGIEIFDKELNERGKPKSSIFTFNKTNKERILELVAYANQRIQTAPPAKAEYYNANNEYYMRCNVCGNIFCYSDQDILRNIDLKQKANRARNAAITQALGGSTLMSTQKTNQADSYENQIFDYTKCPKCNSIQLSQISSNEAKATNNTTTTTNINSPADELKKYKELLDLDIITQEEFDTKKKQLLNL